ncbi:Ubiquitin carboxyl-terminal hydrolase ZUFSP [Glycine soja]
MLVACILMQLGKSWCGGRNNGEWKMDEKISCLLGLQSRGEFHKVERGLMALLSTCLESDSENSRSILSGYVDHFQRIPFEEVGWGCVWRNIQILSSHLLAQRAEPREAMYGGSGFVPDIPSLQRAQKNGLELLRFPFVFFWSPGAKERVRINDARKRKVPNTYGPMEIYLSRAVAQASCCQDAKTCSSFIQIRDTVDKESSDDRVRRVLISHKTPLYFQHDGHSRTIVGIQVKHPRSGIPQYSLLVMDPGHRTAALERSIREKVGWQKFIKRGVHTLRKLQYQLCYVDPGIASEEMEKLKTIDGVFLEF